MSFASYCFTDTNSTLILLPISYAAVFLIIIEALHGYIPSWDTVPMPVHSATSVKVSSYTGGCFNLICNRIINSFYTWDLHSQIFYHYKTIKKLWLEAFNKCRPVSVSTIKLTTAALTYSNPTNSVWPNINILKAFVKKFNITKNSTEK